VQGLVNLSSGDGNGGFGKSTRQALTAKALTAERCRP
jgi:hypothetical protein